MKSFFLTSIEGDTITIGSNFIYDTDFIKSVRSNKEGSYFLEFGEDSEGAAGLTKKDLLALKVMIDTVLEEGEKLLKTTENEVILLLDSNKTGLAGKRNGKWLYEEQLQAQIDVTKEFTIVFPRHVKAIAMSYLDGLFDDLMKPVSKETFFNNFTLIANEKVIKKINSYYEVEVKSKCHKK